MRQRSDELVYTKRFYFLPFKPLMDYEYKKFGYKKCDVKRQKGDFFNTVYYVHHKERPEGVVYRLLCALNRIFSVYRAIFGPVAILATFLLGMVVSIFGNNQPIMDTFIILVALMIPTVILNFIFSYLASRIRIKEDVDGKTDRALKSHGFASWSSYRDNDPRFQPPVKVKAAPTPAPATPQKTSATPKEQPSETDEEPVTLDDQIIEMKMADGTELSFDLLGIVDYRNQYYAVMTLHEPTDEIGTDEAFVFEYTELDNGMANYQFVEDDTINDAVLERFEEMRRQMQNS